MTKDFYQITVQDELAMEALGAKCFHLSKDGLIIYLIGDLGAGKTTFVRGFLRAMNHTGVVKSPTYTLVESYELAQTAYHFDFYRLNDPRELGFMGIRDYFIPHVYALIEWPEKAIGYLPKADLNVHIEIILKGRIVMLNADSDKGTHVLHSLCQ